MHFAQLTSADVVRHRLVADIVDAYGRYDDAEQRRPAGRAERPAHRAAGAAQPRAPGR